MSEVEDKYTRETITSLRVWVPGKLFSFTCTRPSGYRFTAGQFARLGVENLLKLPGEPDIIWRAYSMVSSPYDEHLEFFSIVVPNGAFTSHLSQLEVGSAIYIDKTSFGFLTTSRFESGRDLWLLGSGTLPTNMSRQPSMRRLVSASSIYLVFLGVASRLGNWVCRNWRVWASRLRAWARHSLTTASLIGSPS